MCQGRINANHRKLNRRDGSPSLIPPEGSVVPKSAEGVNLSAKEPPPGWDPEGTSNCFIPKIQVSPEMNR